MFAARSALLTLLLGWFSVTASAQSVVDIELGSSRQQNAGTASDLYRFSGVHGTTVTATLTATGETGLVFYAPEGQEMLSIKGNGPLKLDLVLPFPDIYFVSVLRADATKPYDLKLEGALPDEHFAQFSSAVGYEFNAAQDGTTNMIQICWVKPGVTWRRMVQNSPWVQDVTIGRAGMLYVLHKHPDGRTKEVAGRRTYEGATVTETAIDGAFETQSYPYEIPHLADVAYSGYLCD